MTNPTIAEQARALWFAAPGRAELRAEPLRCVGPGEVRVRTIASAISQGTEMLVFRGQVPADLPLDLPTLAGSFAFPIKYGYAVVGRVVEAGAGVERPSAGDTVFVLHPHQEEFVVPAGLTIRLPDGLDPLAGLFTANLETAVNVLLDTPLRFRETALVLGQGSVGLLITQLLRLAGAAKVIVLEPHARRRDAALAAGADVALAPDAGAVAQIHALTGGRGADVAIEVSGAGDALQTAIDCVAEEGTVVAVSWYGVKPVTLTLGGRFHRGRVRLRSSQVGRLDPALAPRWDHARRMAAVLDLLPRLRLTELITHRVPFEQAADAYRLLDKRPGETVQVILTYDRGG